MKKNILTLLVGLCALGASAQQLNQSAYFMKRANMRHELNPALMNDRGYFSIPMLGDLNVAVNSNVGLSTFLFPTANGTQLNTFMHPDVTSEEFLKGIAKNNKIAATVDLSVLSFGFFAWGGYNTFDWSVNATNQYNLPGSYFEFLKNGQDIPDRTYDLSGLSADVLAVTEFALGHAHPVNDQLTIGVKAKVLVAGAAANVMVDDLSIRMSEEEWRIKAQGSASGSLAGAEFEVDDEGKISGLNYGLDAMGSAGFGLGFDLGATYQLMDKLELSFAVVDLGFLNLKQNLRVNLFEGEVVFDGFNDLTNDDLTGGEGSSFDDRLDDLDIELNEMVKLEPSSQTGSETRSLATTLNLGAEYSVLNDKISFGLLGSLYCGSPKTVTELMGAVNLRPLSWFNLTATGTISNMGCYWSSILNIAPCWINIFLGVEHIPSRFTPQMLPLDEASFNFNMGISVPLNKNNIRKPIALLDI